MNRFVRLSAVLLFIFNVLLAPASFAQPSSTKLATLKLAKDKGIPNQYIVVLKDGPSINAGSVAQAAGVTPRHVYSAALNGFAATLSASQLKAIRSNPQVDYVEQDQEMSINATQFMDANGDPWGLDRIDQRNLALSGSYTYHLTGAGVHAYIIDTGIAAHTEFGASLSSVGFTAISDGNGLNDCNGHGTHVAGIVGGTTYGVAKDVILHPVRVFNCGGSGTTAGVIFGVDYVRLNAIKPAVANMSLGGAASTALNTAVTNMINSGIFTAVAAGQSGSDACSFSPASVPAAYTVAGSMKTDARMSSSNYGPCVDGYAPGYDIKSTWLSNGTLTLRGTSMATAHVTGCAANFLQHNGNVPPATVTAWITNNATNGVITGNIAGTPNKLLYCFKPDVWVKDKSVDQGREPDPATAALNMWESPDIWNRTSATSGPHQNPEFGQTNYLYANLRNRGHIADTGRLYFYVANASVSLAWDVDWVEIGSVLTTVAPGAVVTAIMPWEPAGSGHYCILVRWVSDADPNVSQDPMSYTETIDVNYNTRYNNNIAWRNMNVVDLLANEQQRVRFVVRDLFRTSKPQRLMIREPREQLQDPFLRRGTITLDLGTELTQRWLQAGGRGGGFQRVGETQFRVTDPNGAWFDGLVLEPEKAFSVDMTLGAITPTDTQRPFLIETLQYEEGRSEPIGGVTYEVTMRSK